MNQPWPIFFKVGYPAGGYRWVTGSLIGFSEGYGVIATQKGRFWVTGLDVILDQQLYSEALAEFGTEKIHGSFCKCRLCTADTIELDDWYEPIKKAEKKNG